MTAVNELHVSIIIPQNILHFCCSYTESNKPGVPYKLNETDPERFNKILQIIKTTPSSAYIWEDRTEIENCRKALKNWNMEHKDEQITEEEIIRSVSAENYKHSKIGTDGKYKGVEMHEFHDIDLWGFTKGGTKYKIYLKFVTPGDGTLDIVSFHRDKGVDREDAALYDWKYTDEEI